MNALRLGDTWSNNKSLDAAAYRVTNWDFRHRLAIQVALANGPEYEWDTDYMLVKYSVKSARIFCHGGKLHLECFSSAGLGPEYLEGQASMVIPWVGDLDQIATEQMIKKSGLMQKSRVWHTAERH